MPSDARLIWGSTALISAATENDLRGSSPPAYIIQASADGTNFGNPQAVITEIRSHLQDGSLASVTSYDNREGAVTLMVSALTHDALGKAEAALVAETKVSGFSTLSWTPSVALSVPPTVFDVVYSDLAWQFDDLNEIKRSNGVLRRFFTATFELLPFGRDETATTVQATTGAAPVTPVVTSIDAGSSASGWTTRVVAANGSVTTPAASTSSGYVQLQATLGVGSPARLMSLIRTGSVSMSTDTILVVDWLVQAATNSIALTYTASGTDTTVTPTLSANQASGFTRSYFTLPSSTTFSAMTFTAANVIPTSSGVARLRIDQVSRQNVIPPEGTPRQQSRSITVGGSARARAALAITAGAGSTLGDTTMVYTRTATTGLQPPLRLSYRLSSATTTPDSTNVSGAYNSLGGTAMVFNIPANKIQEAAHDLVLRMRATTLGTYTVTWTAALVSSANADIAETGQSITGTTSVTFPAANVWQTNEVGLLQLPTVPVASDSTNMIRLTLLASSSVVQVDEAWLFDLDNGILSWANTTGLTRLEIRTADTTNPEPSYWGGIVDGGAATGLVRADWRTVPTTTVSASNGGSFAQHYFDPGTMDVFTVTTDTQTSAASATFCRAFLHNVSS